MTNVEIEYCVPCGHLDAAQEIQGSLLEEHGRDLETVTLRTGHGGVLKVRVDGELVFDKAEQGYDLEAIGEAVAEHVDAPSPT